MLLSVFMHINLVIDSTVYWNNLHIALFACVFYMVTSEQRYCNTISIAKEHSNQTSMHIMAIISFLITLNTVVKHTSGSSASLTSEGPWHSMPNTQPIFNPFVHYSPFPQNMFLFCFLSSVFDYTRATCMLLIKSKAVYFYKSHHEGQGTNLKYETHNRSHSGTFDHHSYLQPQASAWSRACGQNC